MAVAHASKLAYREGEAEGTHATEIGKILAVMRAGQYFTRRQISRLTGIEPSAVAGRVNKLVHSVGMLEEAGEKVRCPISTKKVTPVRIKNEYLDNQYQRHEAWEQPALF